MVWTGKLEPRIIGAVENPMRSVIAAVILFCFVPAMLQGAPSSPVVISEDDSTFTLANGIVTAQAAKRSGDLTLLKYRGLEMLNPASRRQAGYRSEEHTSELQSLTN